MILIDFTQTIIAGLMMQLKMNKGEEAYSTFGVMKKAAILVEDVKQDEVFTLDKIYFKKLFSYSVMALVSASTVPVAYIIIRTLVITEIGEVQAGHWEALIRVSSVLVMVMATSYSTYLLPTLSSIKKEDLRKELYKIYKIKKCLKWVNL